MQLQGLRQFNGVFCFPISWIALHDFSPQQVRNALHGIKPLINPAMIKGSKIHSKLFQEFKEKQTEKISIPEALIQSIQLNKTLNSREVFVFSSRLRVFGKIDEIIFSKNFVQVIDDKSSSNARNGYKLQTAAYALTLESQFFPRQQIHCVLRNAFSQEIFWQNKLDESLRQKTLEKIREILELIEEETQLNLIKENVHL